MGAVRGNAMQKFLNVACGTAYVRSPEWENIDYQTRDSFVRKLDILGNLTTSKEKYDVIYCSHFIEHVPPEKVHAFLSRCKSLMREDSLFRIVTPDAELLLREYLKHKDSGNKTYSEFAFLNFLDQCVRLRGGGKLAERYRQLASGELRQLEPYAEYLNGSDVNPSPSTPAMSKAARLRALLSHPSNIGSKIEQYYIKLVCALLPKAFREQNVSFAGIGERHLWVYDFDSLKAVLNKAGFSRVERHSFNTSGRTDNLFMPLEVIDGKPRKGNHQLFLEAQL
jgi:predicted SAM-dependent methyltransferase